jgi:hypothetical protein
MSTKTNKKVALSIDEMETIIAKMRENQQRDRAMSSNVAFDLLFDTDLRAHVIDGVTGYQFSGYAECGGMKVKI